MTVLILGAGRMAYGLVFDFLKNDSISKIIIIDQSQEALKEISGFFKSGKIEIKQLKADDLYGLKPLFKEAKGVISAVPYDYNVDLTELAISEGCHFVDLGGNNAVVEKQFRLAEKAKAAAVGIIPDCGLAPGMTSVIAAHAMDQLARIDDVKIRVGGLPLSPQTPLNYKLVFSVHGLINEYIEPAIILEDGHIKTVESMTGLETLEFPSPFGTLEAFYTSGGTSTLPLTFENKVINLDYKTIRYPGHAHLMKAMIDIGFTDKKAEFDYNGNKYNTRDVFEAMLNSTLQYESEDVVLIRVTATGQKEGKEKTITLQAIEYADKKNNLTAMMRTTAFPAAIILQMLMENKIKDRGVLRQEQAVPGFDFIVELEKRRIFFNEV
ncbi:MAG: saccharopine dehydrogenase NADP-binding domain-containing protein [Calditrichae bacterium]|nr:saccharopine dehydrogenase NADP-binding domain-containing protein [Calditrichota bacterium]MCB9057999.1 saccharopine dehydrogenase NADP-binding domain-containing protein [Calditrichia bacterium]